MPAAMQYYPPTDRNRFKFDTDGDKERRERHKLFTTNEKYYNGDMDSPLMIDENDAVDDNIILSVIKQTVDRTLSFVFPDIPRFVVDPNIDQSPEEKLIDDTIRINGGLVFLNGLVYNGALGGHTFVKIMPPDPLLESSDTFARLVNLHPSQVTIYWDASDKAKTLWYEVRFEAGEDKYIQDTVFDPEGKRWLTTQFVQRKGKTRWEIDSDTDIWDSILSPIVDGQHLPDAVRRYGKPDITNDLRKLNDGVNRVASDVSRILRFHAFPKTVATGVGSANDIGETEIGGLYVVSNPDAEIVNLEMESDLASSMNFLNTLKDDMYLTTRVVKVTGNVKDYQRVTNASIRSVYLDQLAKNQLLRWSYGDLLQRIARRILLLDGKSEVRPTILWQDPLPMDDTEAINTTAIERNLNLKSRETASKERGYDWESEKQKMESEEDLSFVQNQSSQGSQLGQTSKETISV